MLLRGTTMDSKPCVFTLDDIPVKITNKSVALTKEKNTALLLEDTIVRGDSEGGFFEGDLVLDKSFNFTGYIVYRKGFKVLRADTNELMEIPELDSVIINSDINTHKKSVNEIDVEPISWIYNGHLIYIKNIITGKAGKIVTTSNIDRKVSTTQFRLYTGIVVNNKKLCFGDTYKGGVIKLHNHKPMIEMLGGGFKEIEEGN